MPDVIVQCKREWCRKPFPKGNRSADKPYYCSAECFLGKHPETSRERRLTDADVERIWKAKGWAAQEAQYHATPVYRSRRSMNSGEDFSGTTGGKACP